MYWLIETQNQLDNFISKGYKKIFIEIIPFNYLRLPSQNEICGFYIKPIESHKGFFISVSHSEAGSVNITSIWRYITTIDEGYVRDKKEFMHYMLSKKIIDVNPFPIKQIGFTHTHDYFHKKYPEKYDLNRIIPIVKHYEYCENLYEVLEPNFKLIPNQFFNQKTTLVFNALERVIISIDKEEYSKRFHPIKDNFIQSNYNIKTTTTRPSNSVNGVNLLALQKNNGDKKIIIPKNDVLIELDISAFHPTLLAKLIGYNFEGKNVHEEFAKMYGVSYEESKQITFRQLYGQIFDKYKNLEFFQKVQNLIDKLWYDFNIEGYIECSISGYRFNKSELPDMTPQKLLNYYLQNQETTTNIELLLKIFPLLKGKKTRLILYVYDSFLFDFALDETELLEEIKNIFTSNNLQIKEKRGPNYDELH
jgi:hypothetical protein